MVQNNSRTEIDCASWMLEAAETQGTIDEMNEIKELAYQEQAKEMGWY